MGKEAIFNELNSFYQLIGGNKYLKAAFQVLANDVVAIVDEINAKHEDDLEKARTATPDENANPEA